MENGMKRIFSIVAYSFIMFIIASCSDSIVSECDSNKQDIKIRSTFSSIQEEIFTKSCATAGCHGGNFVSGALNLEPQNAFEQLVGFQSIENSNKFRVEVNNSSNSFLIDKLEGNGTTVMPPSGKLPQFMIDSVKAWIDNGALNN